MTVRPQGSLISLPVRALTRVATWVIPVALCACGGKPSNTLGSMDTVNTNTNAPTGSATTGSGTTNGSAGGGAGTGSNGTASGSNVDPGLDMLDEEEICEQVNLAVEFLPIDMHIMLDNSVSMEETVSSDSDTTRWEAITEALRAFFAHPDAQNIRIAYDYFAHPDDTIDLGVYTCNAQNYATPEVPLDLVPTAGPAIEALLGDNPAGTLTPTYPALEGALMWAQANKEANPAKATVVLLATDGLPFSDGSCNDSVAAIAELSAAAFRSENSVRTFVIGVGDGEYNLETIADEGGGQAFLIESADVADEFLNAMLTIVNQPPTCDVEIPDTTPDGEVIDGSRARVVLTDGLTNDETQIRQVSSGQDCVLAGDVDGFYFDNPTNPTKITVCPSTCRKLGRSSIRLDLACRLVGGIQ